MNKQPEETHNDGSVSCWIQALSAPDEIVRCEAAEALGEVGTADEAVVGALIAALRDESALVVRLAAHSLGCIGPAAKAAVPGLLEALNHKDDVVRHKAATALERVVAGDLPTLLELLAAHPEVLPTLVGVLTKIGSGGCEQLVALLGHENANCRCAVVQALGELGEDASSAVPVLGKLLLQDDDQLVRRAAAVALKRIGPAAAQAALALVKALCGDSDPSVRREAASALAEVSIPPRAVH